MRRPAASVLLALCVLAGTAVPAEASVPWKRGPHKAANNPAVKPWRGKPGLPAAKPTPAPPAPVRAPVAPSQPAGDALDDMNARLLELVNQERQAAGVPPLQHSACADGYAQSHARWMLTTKRFEHQDVGVPMLQCGSWGAAENIARGYTSAEALMRGWMNSPGHRRNILNPRYTHMANAVVRDGSPWGGYYGVQVFLQDPHTRPS